jgi:hypothetical protein
MKLVRSVGATCALAALVTFGTGSRPAEAEPVSFTDHVTFTYEGQSVTCTFTGVSEVLYQPVDGGFWSIDVSTRLTDDDAECREALQGTQATSSHRRSEDEPFEYAWSSGQESAELYVEVRSLVDVNAAHGASFECDEFETQPCAFGFETNPK